MSDNFHKEMQNVEHDLTCNSTQSLLGHLDQDFTAITLFITDMSELNCSKGDKETPYAKSVTTGTMVL